MVICRTKGIICYSTIQFWNLKYLWEMSFTSFTSFTEYVSVVISDVKDINGTFTPLACAIK